jgi:GNAT superfamily N-acetyltransferase
MTDIIIRPAATEDLEKLCDLYLEFHEFHVRGVPGRLRSLTDPESRDDTELCEKIKKIIADDDSTIFLAEVGRQPVGLAEVYIREDEPNPHRVCRRHGHLQSLITTERFRHLGVGNKLLEAAEEWAREKGAAEMRLDIWEFAEGPLEFYEKNGYRTLRRSLVREFGPQNDRRGTNEV